MSRAIYRLQLCCYMMETLLNDQCLVLSTSVCLSTFFLIQTNLHITLTTKTRYACTFILTYYLRIKPNSSKCFAPHHFSPCSTNNKWVFSNPTAWNQCICQE